MRSAGSDRYRKWTAAYVLGALVPSEREALERHLVGCDECAASVAEFAWLPAMLSTLTYDHAADLGQMAKAEAPSELLTALAEKVRQRKQRTRFAIAGLVLVISAASAIVATTVISRCPSRLQP